MKSLFLTCSLIFLSFLLEERSMRSAISKNVKKNLEQEDKPTDVSVFDYFTFNNVISGLGSIQSHIFGRKKTEDLYLDPLRNMRETAIQYGEEALNLLKLSVFLDILSSFLHIFFLVIFIFN